MKRCVVGLSGGVDSSTSAFLMKQRGYDVVGCTLKLFKNKKALISTQDALTIADNLKIPLETIDCSEDFEKYVIDYFVQYYKMGKTPSPCIICNESIKFRYLNNVRKKYEASLLVTGHYARIERRENGIRLFQALAKERDQSYFLYAVDRSILEYVEFPLGNVESKCNTREIAKKAGINVSEKPDSQDICFIQENDYISFIKQKLGDIFDFKNGNIRDKNGYILGRHKGILKYTIGQRKGLGLPGGPFFVAAIDTVRNEVVVAPREDIKVNRLSLSKVKFVNEPFDGDCMVKVRSCGTKLMAKIKHEGTEVTLLEPEYGIAQGQHCVFYSNETEAVLGGGEITCCSYSD